MSDLSDLSTAPAKNLPVRAQQQHGEPEDRTILDVTISDMGGQRAIAHIDRALSRRETLYVCFANAHTLNVAAADDRFRAALKDFLLLNDGLGVDIASRIKFGKTFRENLNGTDFLPDFLNKTQHSLRIFLLGSTDDVAEKAALAIKSACPRHEIVGYRNAFFCGPQDIEMTCCDIRKSGADCVLVGMGNPLQELWIHEHARKTGAHVFFGVGALFDFQAGKVYRAPAWVRRVRCEWAFRLLQEPIRLARRYMIGNAVFLGRALVDAYR